MCFVSLLVLCLSSSEDVGAGEGEAPGLLCGPEWPWCERTDSETGKSPKSTHITQNTNIPADKYLGSWAVTAPATREQCPCKYHLSNKVTKNDSKENVTLGPDAVYVSRAAGFRQTRILFLNLLLLIIIIIILWIIIAVTNLSINNYHSCLSLAVLSPPLPLSLSSIPSFSTLLSSSYLSSLPSFTPPLSFLPTLSLVLEVSSSWWEFFSPQSPKCCSLWELLGFSIHFKVLTFYVKFLDMMYIMIYML